MSQDIPEEVQLAFDALPKAQRNYAMQLRQWILEVATDDDAIGELEESLKWGEPSYRPSKPRIGSTVRIASFDSNAVGLYFNCQTMLVENFRASHGDELEYSKNRAVVFRTDLPLEKSIIKQCVSSTLRYHLEKRKTKR